MCVAILRFWEAPFVDKFFFWDEPVVRVLWTCFKGKLPNQKVSSLSAQSWQYRDRRKPEAGNMPYSYFGFFVVHSTIGSTVGFWTFWSTLCAQPKWQIFDPTRARISNYVSGGQCHLNHLTVLRRFSWIQAINFILYLFSSRLWISYYACFIQAIDFIFYCNYSGEHGADFSSRNTIFPKPSRKNPTTGGKKRTKRSTVTEVYNVEMRMLICHTVWEK